MATNCFKLKPDGECWDGLAWSDRIGRKGCIMVGPQNGVLLWHEFMFVGGMTPDVVQGMLFRAAPLVHHQTKVRVLSHKGDWRGALVLIETRDLNFRETGMRLKVPEAVAGVESMEAPIMQIGEKFATEKFQLVAVECGELLFIADHERRYVCYRCENGILRRQKATVQQLCELYVRRARVKYTRSYYDLNRCWNVLKKLGYLDLWSRDLETALRATKLT